MDLEAFGVREYQIIMCKYPTGIFVAKLISNDPVIQAQGILATGQGKNYIEALKQLQELVKPYTLEQLIQNILKMKENISESKNMMFHVDDGYGGRLVSSYSINEAIYGAIANDRYLVEVRSDKNVIGYLTLIPQKD